MEQEFGKSKKDVKGSIFKLLRLYMEDSPRERNLVGVGQEKRRPISGNSEKQNQELPDLETRGSFYWDKAQSDEREIIHLKKSGEINVKNSQWDHV